MGVSGRCIEPPPCWAVGRLQRNSDKGRERARRSVPQAPDRAIPIPQGGINVTVAAERVLPMHRDASGSLSSLGPGPVNSHELCFAGRKFTP
jgi:hypothetical protein